MNRFLLFFLIISSISISQTKISGLVTDKNGGPLPSANVYLKNTYDGASTNAEGKYFFTTEVTGEQTLVASFIGYTTKEIKIKIDGKEVVTNIVLEETASSTRAVVISAGAFEASDENKSVIFKPLDILTTGSTADIYTAISTLPGTQQIGETEGLFVRGGSAAETKTIIDEMIVQKPFYSTVPDVASRGRFSPQLFKGILFSAGGYSAQYGQALSSTLILKSTDLAPDTRSSINIMSVGLGGSHVQRWENTSLSVEGGYYNLSPYYKIQKDRLDWNKIPSTIEGNLVFRHKTSETGIFKVYSSFSDNYMKLYLKNLDNLSQKDLYGLRSDNFYLNTSYTDILGKEWTFFSGISYSKDVDKIEFNSDNIKTTNEMSQTKITLSRHIIDGSFITFGGEVNKQTFKDTFNEFGRDVHDYYAAGFAETDIFFTNNIAARFGLRLENSSTINKLNLAPRISLAFKLGQYDQINLAYGQFYQIPEREFLFQKTGLEYEKAIHYIVNYQYIGAEFTFRVEGYYKDYKNLVKQISTLIPPYSELQNKYDISTEYGNSGKGYAKGIDVFLRYNRFNQDGNDFWLSYTYLDTKREYQDFPTMAPPVFATPHTFSAVCKQFVSQLQALFGFTFSYATGRPYFNPNNPVFHGDRTKDFINISGNMSYLTNIFGNFTVIFFSIDNIFAFDNIYTYRNSKDGTVKEPIRATSSRFLFLGVFISLGENTTGF
jgi:hypothetical protein